MTEEVLTPIQCVRDQIAWIKRLLDSDVKARGTTDQSGHPHGYAIVEVPDWDLRQKLEYLEESLKAHSVTIP